MPLRPTPINYDEMMDDLRRAVTPDASFTTTDPPPQQEPPPPARPRRLCRRCNCRHGDAEFSRHDAMNVPANTHFYQQVPLQCNDCLTSRLFSCDICHGETCTDFRITRNEPLQDDNRHCRDISRTDSQGRQLRQVHTCPTCSDARYVSCSECGNSHLQSQFRPLDDGGQIIQLCEACWQRYQPEPVTLPEVSDVGYLTPRHFAVELEVINQDEANTNTLVSETASPGMVWTPCSDGSLSSGGIELCSGPIGGQGGIQHVTRAANWMSRNGFKVDRSCGFHLHLDFHNETPEQVCKFMRLCYALQDWSFKTQDDTRQNSSYCRPLSDDQYRSLCRNRLEEAVYGRSSVRFRDKKSKYNDARYCWINGHSYFYRGTVEIRLHGGTRRAHKVLRWTEFWLKAAEYALATPVGLLDSMTDGVALARTLRLRSRTIEYFENRTALFSEMRLRARPLAEHTTEDRGYFASNRVQEELARLAQLPAVPTGSRPHRDSWEDDSDDLSGGHHDEEDSDDN